MVIAKNNYWNWANWAMCRLTRTTQLTQFSVNLFVHAGTWFGTGVSSGTQSSTRPCEWGGWDETEHPYHKRNPADAGVIIFQLPTPSVRLPCHGRVLGKELEPGKWQCLAITLLCYYKSSTYKVNSTRATRHPTCCSGPRIAEERTSWRGSADKVRTTLIWHVARPPTIHRPQSPEKTLLAV